MKKRLIILSIITTLIVAAIAIIGIRYAFYQGYIRMNYPSLEDYPVQGIDVSHHQKDIRWEVLDKQRVQYAFIKATEGGDHKDSLFEHNWKQAKAQGIAVGGYHFFTFCRSGEEQALNFIASVPNDSTNMPPAIDLEFGGNCRKENQVADLMAEITTYINMVEQHYQKRVIIYSTNEFYKQYLIGQFPENPVWIRDILSTPSLPDKKEWAFWQFANRGHLEGIETEVDLNVYKGSQADFERFVSTKNVN
ncbi:GH25 family lysozyme [Dysgonomonas sp. 25]|uniref:glycoside hydrolase family 25 protein n=1 Tax=Dysgonomonas sp. 25 TaxID=2302933 RepID=UPI0013CF8532|nr:GH25 family lysozyme [Dysgonomonas sp. 25]NDV68457.1 lysozyme [Dysgonomonas sp. 25]